MKTLLILRHAKSSWENASQSDHDRPLNKRGKRTAPLVGGLIRDEKIVPDLILSSTARRARETAFLVGENCGYTRAVELRAELYPTSVERCLTVLRQIDGENDCLLVVGHNPGLEEVVERLTLRFERLPTAALVQLSLDLEDWPDLSESTSATLVNLWRPREIF